MTVTRAANRYAEPVKWVSLGLIVLALLVLLRALPVGRAVEALQGTTQELGWLGPVVFGGIYVAATVLMLPGLILTIAAGAFFGLGIGTIVVSLASTLGAAAAFLIARYVARRKVAEVAQRNPKFGAIDRAVGEGGWKIVALLRLSPAIPFNLQNYLYGLTPIPFWPYVLASWVAMLPGTFLYVYIGHVTGATVGGDRERTTGEWVLLGVGLAATVAVTIYVTHLARTKLKEQTSVEQAQRTSPEPRSGWPWGASATALVALLLSVTAACAWAKPNLLQNWFGGLAGAPPQVEMREAYARDPDGPTFDHALLDELLKSHVNERGGVDYEGLARDRERLREYIEALGKASFESLGRDEKLALLINAYNAFTLELILEHDSPESIHDIPAEQRWDAVRWEIGDHVWSLNEIEHEQIRPKFREPRIHFVLVCAAVGCPPLRREAYVGERIERQLEEQTRWCHQRPRWLQLDEARKVVRLTSLYDWYGGDFEQIAGSPLAFAERYHDRLKALRESGERLSVKFLDYDWSLNSQVNVP